MTASCIFESERNGEVIDLTDPEYPRIAELIVEAQESASTRSWRPMRSSRETYLRTLSSAGFRRE